MRLVYEFRHPKSARLDHKTPDVKINYSQNLTYPDLCYFGGNREKDQFMRINYGGI